MILQQNDSVSSALESPISGEQTQQTYARPRTVYQVIRSLPRDATPDQQDSAVQANFKADTLAWAPKAKLGLPGFVVDEGHIHLPKVNLYNTLFTKLIPWKLPHLPYNEEGIAGDPLPYRLRTDDYVTGMLLVSFFLVVWVISRSARFLSMQVKNLFYTPDRESQVNSGTGNELRGQLFLVFQTCFILGILFFVYTQFRLTDVFNQISPYKLLALDVGLCVVYYVIKIILYTFINWIFFDSRQNSLWAESYLLSILAVGLSLFPVALVVVYFDFPFDYAVIIVLSLLLLTKILLLYKSYTIFFGYPLGYLHLFLYFCTLEILPLLVLWRVLIYANNYLVTIF